MEMPSWQSGDGQITCGAVARAVRPQSTVLQTSTRLYGMASGLPTGLLLFTHSCTGSPLVNNATIVLLPAVFWWIVNVAIFRHALASFKSGRHRYEGLARPQSPMLKRYV